MKPMTSRIGRCFRRIAPVLAVLAGAGSGYAWEIARFHADILIQTNGTLEVRETIVADFTGESHRGIYRAIPICYRDRFGRPYRIRVDVLGVTDERNQPLEFLDTPTDCGRRIRIGSADVAVAGLQTYRLRYRVDRAVRFLGGHDELFWEATGNDWSVPIRQASARLQLALAPGPNRVKALGFTGAHGHTTGAAVVETDDAGATWEAKGILRPLEGLTLVAAWPQGMVTRPTWVRVTGWFIADHPRLCVLLAVVALLLGAWALSCRKTCGCHTGAASDASD
jgi:hypothetical protein